VRKPDINETCMFLAQTALGRQFEVIQDDRTRIEPPSGFQSRMARGVQAPERKAALEIDGHKVIVPQDPSVDSHVSSVFRNKEYVLYDASRVRLRYSVSYYYPRCTLTNTLLG
jgi:hypothetical protein